MKEQKKRDSNLRRKRKGSDIVEEKKERRIWWYWTIFFLIQKEEMQWLFITGLECHLGGLGKNQNVLELSLDIGQLMTASKIAGKIMIL